MKNTLLPLALFAAGLGFPALASAQTTYTYTGPVRDSVLSQTQYFSGPLLAASDGNFYASWNDSNGGRIERITPNGVVTVIHNFTSGGSQVYAPLANLIQGPDGYLYGQLASDPVNHYGDFYKIALDGSNFTVLYAFNIFLDGGPARGGLTLGADGNFYGFGSSYDSYLATPVRPRLAARLPQRPQTRKSGHASRPAAASPPGPHTNNLGECEEYPENTFYQLTPAGTMTVLDCTYGNDPLDGINGPPVQASDGDYYAFTSLTYSGSGELVKLDSSGNETTVGPAPDGTEYSQGNLVGGPDGNFYVSVTDSDCGGVLQIVPTDSYQTEDNLLTCAQANTPVGTLYLGTDDAFYGAALSDTTSQSGSIFAVSPYVGLYDYAYHFNGTSGGAPTAPPVQGRDGNFYGDTAMTDTSIDDGLPTYYRLVPSTPLAAPVTLTSSSATVVSGTPLPLAWTVHNASPLTPPVCIALVDNATGPEGWTGILAGEFFDNGDFGGYATAIPAASGNLSDYQVVCNGQGSAAATYLAPPLRPSATSVTVAPGTSMVTGSQAIFTVTVAPYNDCGSVPVRGIPDNTSSPECQVTLPARVRRAQSVPGQAIAPAQTHPPHSAHSGWKTTQPAPASHTARPAPQPEAPPLYPTGTVTLSIGSSSLGQITLAQGTGSLSALNTVGVPAGKYTVTAHYPGDSVFAASTTDQTVTITGVTSTTALTVTDLTAGGNGPITLGDTIQFQASITAPGNTYGAAGTVSFYYESNLICSASVTGNGTATCSLPTANLPAGSYPVYAVYAGDTFHLPATSASTTVTLQKASTTAVLSSTSPTLPEDGSDTFTAVVTSNGLPPTGTVLIHDSWYRVCTATLVNGSATCTAQASPRTYQTTYHVTATYEGDANNKTCNSPSIPITVIP